MFESDILCTQHENQTADYDRYGVDFVRRLIEAVGDDDRLPSVIIENPKPAMLACFVVATVWREANSRTTAGTKDRLGKYDAFARQIIFGGMPCPWPILVCRTNMVLQEKSFLRYSLHPFRMRFMDRSAWQFDANGVSFFLITDGRGLRADWIEFRADVQNELRVIVADPQKITDVPILQPIFKNMLRKT